MSPSTLTPDEPLPWHVGVYDAHCHPTDTVSSVARVPDMKTRALVIMASRREDQQLVNDFAEQVGRTADDSQDGYIIPSFGWHPWFSHQIVVDTDSSLAIATTKAAHYQQVITPCPQDEEFLVSLPEPILLTTLLEKTRFWLEKYPKALVGEIGLDRAFRIPGTEVLDLNHDSDPALTPGSRDGRRLSRYRVDMDHQRRILTAQLNLAGEMKRAVSVHGVAAHGILYDTLAATWKGHEKKSRRQSQRHRMDPANVSESATTGSVQALGNPFPPRICLHSFSGQPDALRRYLHPTVPATVYFSFSMLVNFASRSEKSIETVKAVPDDRILVESDLHVAGEQMDDLMEKVIRQVCEIKGWSLVDGTSQMATNWRRFVFG